jgi:BTB/POZ domain-containing protein 3/6
MALNSEGFIDIDHPTLTSILSRETLNCKELHVFNAAMAWAAAECDRKEIDTSTDNLRAVLGNVDFR